MKDLAVYQSLVDSFKKLPGIGTKSAERMASAVLDMDEEDALGFAKSIEDAKKRIHKCLYTDADLCEVCSDSSRDHSVCVVISYPKDALAFEKIPDFHAVYHVLGGAISPSRGVGAEDLAIDSLLARIEKEGFQEIVIATNPTLEGETTSLFLAHLLQGKNIKITRLGYGLPMGASLDYADSLTLSKALEGRRTL